MLRTAFARFDEFITALGKVLFKNPSKDPPRLLEALQQHKLAAQPIISESLTELRQYRNFLTHGRFYGEAELIRSIELCNLLIPHFEPGVTQKACEHLKYLKEVLLVVVKTQPARVRKQVLDLETQASQLLAKEITQLYTIGRCNIIVKAEPGSIEANLLTKAELPARLEDSSFAANNSSELEVPPMGETLAWYREHARDFIFSKILELTGGVFATRFCRIVKYNGTNVLVSFGGIPTELHYVSPNVTVKWT